MLAKTSDTWLGGVPFSCTRTSASSSSRLLLPKPIQPSLVPTPDLPTCPGPQSTFMFDVLPLLEILALRFVCLSIAFELTFAFIRSHLAAVAVYVSLSQPGVPSVSEDEHEAVRCWACERGCAGGRASWFRVWKRVPAWAPRTNANLWGRKLQKLANMVSNHLA